MSSKRRIRRRSCSRKVRYADTAAAAAAMQRVIRQKGWTGRMNAYRCAFCGGAHFGHAPRAR